MRFAIAYTILSLLINSCSSSDNDRTPEVIVEMEVSEHEHPHDHGELEKRIETLEKQADTPAPISFEGQEAEAIFNIMKRSPFLAPHIK